MLERNLGSSGLRVSTVGIGCNNFGSRIDTKTTGQVIDKAIDLGVTLFDTADVYSNRGGSETAMGEVLGAKRRKIGLRAEARAYAARIGVLVAVGAAGGGERHRRGHQRGAGRGQRQSRIMGVDGRRPGRGRPHHYNLRLA